MSVLLARWVMWELAAGVRAGSRLLALKLTGDATTDVYGDVDGDVFGDVDVDGYGDGDVYGDGRAGPRVA